MPPKSHKIGPASRTSGHIPVYKCTSCTEPIKSTYDAKLHPLIDCLLCRKCYVTYGTGDFATAWSDGVDEQGDDNYCRWCCDGGDLFGCMNEVDGKRCHYSFCKDCIIRNVPDDDVLNMDKLGEEDRAQVRWRCYACDKDKISSLRKEAENALKELNTRTDFKRSNSSTPETAAKKRKSENGVSSSNNNNNGIGDNNNTDTNSGNSKSKSPAPSGDSNRASTNGKENSANPTGKESNARTSSATARESAKTTRGSTNRESTANGVSSAKDQNRASKISTQDKEKSASTAGSKNQDAKDTGGQPGNNKDQGGKESAPKSTTTASNTATTNQSGSKNQPTSGKQPAPVSPKVMSAADIVFMPLGKESSSVPKVRPSRPTPKPPVKEASLQQTKSVKFVPNVVKGPTKVTIVSSNSVFSTSSGLKIHNPSAPSSQIGSSQANQTGDKPGVAAPRPPLRLTEQEVMQRLEMIKQIKDSCFQELESKFETILEMFSSKENSLFPKGNPLIDAKIESMAKAKVEFATMVQDLKDLNHRL